MITSLTCLNSLALPAVSVAEVGCTNGYLRSFSLRFSTLAAKSSIDCLRGDGVQFELVEAEQLLEKNADKK